jgi:hypothetical protein
MIEPSIPFLKKPALLVQSRNGRKGRKAPMRVQNKAR